MTRHPIIFLAGDVGALLVVIALRGSSASVSEPAKPKAPPEAPVEVRHTLSEPDVPLPDHAAAAHQDGATHGVPRPEDVAPAAKAPVRIQIAPKVTDGLIDLHNTHCPVMEGEVAPDVYTDWQGLRVHWCCEGCFETFAADPASHLAKFGITDLDAFKAGLLGGAEAP